MNGIGLHRNICKDVDAGHDRTEWQLKQELGRYGETKPCKDLEATMLAVADIDKLKIECETKACNKLDLLKLFNPIL